MKANKGFWISLLTPVLILAYMTIQPVSTYFFGNAVVLQTIPFDPRDLFYGEYVDLRFQIEEVTEDKLDVDVLKEMNGELYNNTPVFVNLTREGEYFTISKVTVSQPTEAIYLKAELMKTEDGYHIKYPMNRFYVEEGKGRELEKLARTGKLSVTMKVKDGYAIITKVGQMKTSD